MPRPTAFALPVLAALLPPLAGARAALLIDQASTAGGLTTSNSTDIGQSFTPSLAAIDFATFTLGSGAAQITLRLYDGQGYAGALLGTSRTISISGNGVPFASTFGFGGTIALAPGQPYTLRLTSTGGSFSAVYANTDPYAGGIAYAGAAGFPAVDLRFAEGIDAVPEPATWATTVGGLALAGGALRRRRAARERRPARRRMLVGATGFEPATPRPPV